MIVSSSSSSSPKLSKLFLKLYIVISLFSINEAKKRQKRIAIIGGGISGTFAAKYLSDYDTHCDIDSITIFEESPISSSSSSSSSSVSSYDNGKDSSGGKSCNSNDEDDDNNEYYNQGGRVASISTKDGQIVEVGASIIHNANKYVTDLVKGDEDLKMVPPFHSGIITSDDITGIKSLSSQIEDTSLQSGLGIWNGTNWSFLSTKYNSYNSSIIQTAYIMLRYNIDIILLKRTSSDALQSFRKLYKLLSSNDAKTFYKTPDDVWKSIDLYNYTQISFDTLLDNLDITKSLNDLPWYRKYLPYQGSLREELATSMNVCNYNQNNKQLNGLVGLISFLPSGGDLYSIEGGNYRIIYSALKQANIMRSQYCSKSANEQNRINIQHIPKRISKVVNNHDTYFELFSTTDTTTDKEEGDQLLGQYEIVILAAPLSQANISFHQKTTTNSNDIIEPLPLSHLQHNNKELSSPSTKKYTQVITTVVSNAYSLHEYFNTTKEQMPKSTCVTDSGKKISGFSCITQITYKTGTYKMFTSTKPTLKYLQKLFGINVTIEHIKTWGGNKYGGATPDYYYKDFTDSNTIPFLLYDCNKKSKGPGLFYINTIESSASAIEISAIGAKIVSKLVSFRLGLIDKIKNEEYASNDEL